MQDVIELILADAEDEKHMDVFTKMLDEFRVKYTVGKTWTTDGFYREMAEKIKRRKQQIIWIQRNGMCEV